MGGLFLILGLALAYLGATGKLSKIISALKDNQGFSGGGQQPGGGSSAGGGGFQ